MYIHRQVVHDEEKAFLVFLLSHAGLKPEQSERPAEDKYRNADIFSH